MSNIIEGDSVKNFGEFIPNPYIEKVTVEDAGTDLVKLTIEYSLLFLVGDQFDISDVADLFYENTINVYGMLEAKTTNSPSTRQDLIRDIHNGNISDTTIIRTNSQDKLGFVRITGGEALADALKAKKIEYKLNPGDGAFYGPKIDFHIKDAIGRSWQCGTIQLDFSMPEKFDLTYEGQDGKKHRPVMLHRAIYGSLERFMGVLIEHFAGWFPLWLNPLQVRVITVSKNFNKYAEKVVEELKEAGIRVDSALRAETTGKKVRDSQIEKIPILLTIGEKEVKAKTVAVRTNSDGKVKFGVKVNSLIKKILDNVDKKELEFKL